MSLLATALSRAHDFLLAPAGASRAPAPSAVAGRPLDVAVVGLRSGCGASTVAAGLARALSSTGVERWHVAELGRAEVLRHRPDVTVLVVPEDVEPALASIVTGIVSERIGRVVVVANRVRDRERWDGRAALCIPDARLGAVLAGRGRVSPGQFGVALARLAEIVAEIVVGSNGLDPPP